MKSLTAPNNPAGDKSNNQTEKPPPIAWHPAFVEAIQLELEAFRDFLEFLPEYQLTSEPLRIDCVVIYCHRRYTAHTNNKQQPVIRGRKFVA